MINTWGSQECTQQKSNGCPGKFKFHNTRAVNLFVFSQLIAKNLKGKKDEKSLKKKLVIVKSASMCLKNND